MSPRLDLRDERGTTLVELLVGMSMGMIILTALTTMVIVTLHGESRVSARVEGTQNGRLVLTKITEELHSACVAPKIAPVKEGSTGTKLVFIRASGSEASAVAPSPTLTEIKLESETLKQVDFASTGGTAPNWTFSNTGTTTTLMTKVAPIPSRTAIFTYYSYLNGGLSELSASPSLGSTNAAKTIQVQVALNTSPRTAPVKDAGNDASIQDSAVLRLTPPSFNENAVALPCQ